MLEKRGILPYLPVVVVAILFADAHFAAETIWLSSLDPSRMTAGWGKPRMDKSIEGKPMSIAGSIEKAGKYCGHIAGVQCGGDDGERSASFAGIPSPRSRPWVGTIDMATTTASPT